MGKGNISEKGEIVLNEPFSFFLPHYLCSFSTFFFSVAHENFILHTVFALPLYDRNRLLFGINAQDRIIILDESNIFISRKLSFKLYSLYI